MKHIVRVFLFAMFALWLTSQIFPTIVIAGSWQTLLVAGAIFALLMLFVHPMLKILFIPINIITFGLLSWLINVIVLWLLTVFVPAVEVRPWQFPGYSVGGFVIPAISFSYPLALILSSLSITFISNILHDVSEG
ncbi:phage holin family protein [Patescibacteria group bacterium]|nr:phage holin family protein [Patescibacteria group bacterium]